MTGTGALLAASLLVPAALLLACLSRAIRARMPALLALAPVPALAAALLAAGEPPLVLPAAFFHATLALDAPSAMLLLVAALLWIAAGAYAATFLRGAPDGGSFAVWWLIALAGNVGVFMAADIPGFYLFLAMASLAAYGLIVHNGTARARRAGIVYVGLALVGEAAILMGLVLVAAAAPSDSLLIREAMAALPASPWRDAAVALVIAGFGLKIGLVPLHVWMPLAYSAAPIPAAAVLSGAAVKAGVVGLIRFLPFDAALPDWGAVLAVAGLVSAFYGVAIGITQSNPRTVLAYSSVSQMGLIAAVIGMGLAAGDSAATEAAAFYAAHHVLVKGALFLAIGAAAVTGARRLWPVLLPAAVIAIGLAGLPLTGGALAKAAVKAPLGDGVVGVLAALSAAGTTLLMLHFLQRLVASAPSEPEGAPPAERVLPWHAIALASLVVPWALSPVPLSEVFSAAGLWAAAWPLLLGGVAAIGLHQWRDRLPQVPEGDVVVALDGATRMSVAAGQTLERADAVFRRWPVAGISLLALTVVLGVTMAAGR